MASATTTRSARPAARSAAASRLVAHQAGERGGPRGPGGGQAQAARLARPRPGRRPSGAGAARPRGRSRPARRRRRARPATTASGRSSGSTAAIERANRIAVPRPAPARERPSQRASPSVIRSGVRVSDTRVATRSPTARPSGDSGPDRVDDADQHAAGAGHRVLHLAALGDDLEDRGAHGRAVAAVRLGQLAERGGVEVQPLDGDAHLVRADRRVGVQPPGRLRQHAGRLEHPVHARALAACVCVHRRLSRLTRSLQKNLACHAPSDRRFSRRVTRVAEDPQR